MLCYDEEMSDTKTITAVPKALADFIPLDKSWIIRMGVLDLVNGHDDMITYLQTIPADHLCTDLQALLRTSKAWNTGEDIDVGESGTLYRFLQFADWKQGGKRKFIKRGTLADRPITSDSSIVDLPIDKLLQLDNGTSQWASIAVLLSGDTTRPKESAYKLDLTYEALEHWQNQRKAGKRWEIRYDQTILNQTQAFLQWIQTGTMEFEPEQAEDYCFARAFDLMDATQGEKRWPSLRQHESDRIMSMEVSLNEQQVDSADHRVVQAVAMRKGTGVEFLHPESVAKSWPRFWEMWDTVYKRK